MEIVNCRAIVLKLQDYRENDRLVTLFTLEHGRLIGVARGAKRSIKRFGGALELFALLDVQMKHRHSLSELVEADIQTIHSGIRGDLARIAQGAYACELIAALAPEGMANARLFRLMASYLDHLDRSAASNSDRRFFEINLLNILGYRPSLDLCSRCGAQLGGGAGKPATLSYSEILCCDCSPVSREFSRETLGFLSACLNTGRFGSVSSSPATLAEAGLLLDGIIESHLAAPLRSTPFLLEMVGE